MFASLGQVVWFSSKVTDGAPLADICDLAAACSLLGPADAIVPGLGGYCHEAATGERWDYDERSFDETDEQAQAAIRAVIVALALNGQTTILPFFAYRLTSRIALAIPNVRLLGNPPDLERMFDQKPWVERELSQLGVRVVGWRHYFRSTLHFADIDFPLVVRPPAGTGGQGMYLLQDARDLGSLRVGSDLPSFVSVAEYLAGWLSVNVTGCVNADGSVSCQPVSLQIVGAPDCTPRTFGYCGNDFGSAARLLDRAQVNTIERQLHTVGRWMNTYGFRGAFGLDFMVKDGDVLVSELNPRFQGSSHLGSWLAREAGLEDVYQQHIRSHLGVPSAGPAPPLADIVAAQRDLAQVFCYAGVPDAGNAGDTPPTDDERVEFLPSPSTRLDPHALLFRYVTRQRVLDAEGKALLGVVGRRLQALRRSVVDRPLVGATNDDD